MILHGMTKEKQDNFSVLENLISRLNIKKNPIWENCQITAFSFKTGKTKSYPRCREQWQHFI